MKHTRRFNIILLCFVATALAMLLQDFRGFNIKPLVWAQQAAQGIIPTR